MARPISTTLSTAVGRTSSAPGSTSINDGRCDQLKGACSELPDFITKDRDGLCYMTYPSTRYARVSGFIQDPDQKGVTYRWRCGPQAGLGERDLR